MAYIVYPRLRWAQERRRASWGRYLLLRSACTQQSGLKPVLYMGWGGEAPHRMLKSDPTQSLLINCRLLNRHPELYPCNSLSDLEIVVASLPEYTGSHCIKEESKRKFWVWQSV